MKFLPLALTAFFSALSLTAKTWKVEADIALDTVNSWDVRPGDEVLFRRGCIWRGTLKPKSGTNSRPIRYGAFGEGEKPQLSQSVEASRHAQWKSANHDRRFGLWATADDLTEALSDEVGCLMACAGKVQDGQTQENIWQMVESETNVVDQMHFCYEAEKRRVVAKRWSNPVDWLGNVELWIAKPIVDARECHDVVFDGLAVRFGATYGFHCESVENVVVRNCDISYIGGARRDGVPFKMQNGRFGDGIRFGGKVRNCRVERCRLWQMYDAAVAIEGGDIDGLAVRDNVTWKCEQAIRYGADGGSTRNVRIEHNTFADAGFGWARTQRRSRRLARHVLLATNKAETVGFCVVSNLFHRTLLCAVEQMNEWPLELDGNHYDLPFEWGKVVNNNIFRRSWKLSDDGKPEEFLNGKKEFERFRAATGYEKNGIYAEAELNDPYRKDYRFFENDSGRGARNIPSVDEDQSLGECSKYDVAYLRSRRFSITADGREEYVMVARGRYNGARDPGGPYAFSNIESDGPVKLVVKSLDGRDISKAAVRPARAPVKTRAIDSATLEIEVARPCKFTVEPDERLGALLVFVNATEKNAPNENDPNVKVFGPGIHRVPGDIIRLKSNQTLYLKKGAVVQAAVSAMGDDIRICGRGVLDGSIYQHTWGKKGPNYSFVHLTRGRNMLLEDVTLLGSFHWTVYPEAVDNVTLRNVKIVGDRNCNDDGIDPSNARDVLIEDCFFRTQDDCIAVKGINMKNGPCERITVTNSIFWCDFARIVCLGHESNAPHISDFKFVDNDVLYYVRPLLIVQPADNMSISNVLYRDVRVHTDTRRHCAAEIDIRPVNTVYSKTKEPGRVENIRIENVRISGIEVPVRVSVKGYDNSRVSKDISIGGISFNGRPVTAQTPASPLRASDKWRCHWFDDPAFRIGEYVSGVTVERGAQENPQRTMMPRDTPGWWKRWGVKKTEEKQYQKGSVDTVLLGDFFAHAWERVPAFERLRKDRSVLSLGYAGDRVRNVLWRCVNGELAGYQARRIVLCVGKNDLADGASPEAVFEAVNDLVAVLRRRQSRAKILITAIPPSDGKTGSLKSKFAQSVSAFNKLLATLEDGKNIEILDLGNDCLLPDGKLKRKLYLDDRIHFNAGGYDLWMERLK